MSAEVTCSKPKCARVYAVTDLEEKETALGQFDRICPKCGTLLTRTLDGIEIPVEPGAEYPDPRVKAEESSEPESFKTASPEDE